MQDAQPENDFKRTLMEFVLLGQRILSTDHVGHYQRQISKFRGFQPGFMPLKKTKLCIVSCYPNLQVSFEDSPARKAEEQTLTAWKNAGSIESYEVAYKTFLRDVVEWGITKKYVIRVLEEAHVQTDEIAWLNVIKVPLEAGSPKSAIEDLSKRDLPWLHDQVQLIHSNSVIAGRSYTDLPCLIETKLALSLIQTSQDFYLHGLVARAEVQLQTRGQTLDQIMGESRVIGNRLRERIRLAEI